MSEKALKGEKKLMNLDEGNHLLRYEYNRDTPYEKDVSIDKVLAALTPEKDLATHDHCVFQILHVNTELSWYAIHFEIRGVIASLQSGDYAHSVSLMERIVLLAEFPYLALHTLIRTVTQFSLLNLRSHLSAGATGFDSPGMRNMKLITRALWSTFEQTLAQHGHTPVSFALLRAELEGEKALPDRLALLAQVYDGIQTFDVKLMEWKQLHLRLVWGHLGGSSAFLKDSKIAESITKLEDHQMENSESSSHANDEETKYSIPMSLRGRPITDLQHVTTAPMFPALWKIPDAVYQLMSAKNREKMY